MALRSELLLRGLPWNCTNAHVSLWLLSHGLDAREGEITMVDCRRRPSGRAIVYCQSNQAAMTAALAVHLQRYGGRYIEPYVHTEVDQIFRSAFNQERSRQSHGESAAAGVCSGSARTTPWGTEAHSHRHPATLRAPPSPTSSVSSVVGLLHGLRELEVPADGQALPEQRL